LKEEEQIKMRRWVAIAGTWKLKTGKKKKRKEGVHVRRDLRKQGGVCPQVEARGVISLMNWKGERRLERTNGGVAQRPRQEKRARTWGKKNGARKAPPPENAETIISRGRASERKDEQQTLRRVSGVGERYL